jgi:hypothetical protein
MDRLQLPMQGAASISWRARILWLASGCGSCALDESVSGGRNMPDCYRLGKRKSNHGLPGSFTMNRTIHCRTSTPSRVTATITGLREAGDPDVPGLRIWGRGSHAPYRTSQLVAGDMPHPASSGVQCPWSEINRVRVTEGREQTNASVSRPGSNRGFQPPERRESWRHREPRGRLRGHGTPVCVPRPGGAGDRDRTGMASLEGLGLQAVSWLLNAGPARRRASCVPRPRQHGGRPSGFRFTSKY